MCLCMCVILGNFKQEFCHNNFRQCTGTDYLNLLNI